MLGQGIAPRQWDPLADTLPIAELQTKAAELREGLHRAIARMPSHAEFIEKNCKARLKRAPLPGARRVHFRWTQRPC